MKSLAECLLPVLVLTVVSASPVRAQRIYVGNYDTPEGRVIWGDESDEEIIYIGGSNPNDVCVFTVSLDSRLEIWEGTRIVRQQSSDIVVEGSIEAIGTATNPIEFIDEAPRRDYLGGGGHPGGSYFVEFPVAWDGPGSHFEWCNFTDLQGAVHYERFGSQTQFVDCVFRDCGAFLLIDGAQLNLKRCSFLVVRPPSWYSFGVNWITEFMRIGQIGRYLARNCIFQEDIDPDYLIEVGNPSIRMEYFVNGAYESEQNVVSHCVIDTKTQSIRNNSRLFVNNFAPQDPHDMQGPRFLNNVLLGVQVFATHPGNLQEPFLVHGNVMENINETWELLYGNAVPNDNFMVPERDDIFYAETYRLRYTPGGDESVDGINDGFLETEGDNDLDGSLPDIGPFGGQYTYTDTDSQYVVLVPGVETSSNDFAQIPSGIYNVIGNIRIVGTNGDASFTNPGLTLRFDANTGIIVVPLEPDIPWQGIHLTFDGLAGEPIILESYPGVSHWAGISLPFAYADLSLNWTTIRHADIGVRVRSGTEVSLSNSSVLGCETGLWALGNGSVGHHGGSNHISGCTTGIEYAGAHSQMEIGTGDEFVLNENDFGIVALNSIVAISSDMYGMNMLDNKVGVTAMSNSSLSLQGVLMQGNKESGVFAAAGSTVDLSNCVVSENGRGMQFSGGLIAVGGSNIGMKCSEVVDNIGAGVYVNSGTLTMQDIDAQNHWGGNDISGNFWFGQIDIRPGILQMDRGNNHVSGPEMPPMPPLVWYDRRPVDCTHWTGQLGC